MRAKGVWHPADTLTVNIFLNALSTNSEAAFGRYARFNDTSLAAMCLHHSPVHGKRAYSKAVTLLLPPT